MVIARGIRLDVRLRGGPAGTRITLAKQGDVTKGHILTVHWLPTPAVVALVGKVILVKVPVASRVPLIIGT